MSRPVVTAAFAIFLCCTIFAIAESSIPKDDPVLTHMPKYDELDDLKRKAMAGSGNAALSLSLWYMKFPGGGDTDEKWIRIAAENGSSAGQFNLGLIYAQDKSPLNQIRARYWLELAEKSGNPRATEELRQLDVPAP